MATLVFQLIDQLGAPRQILTFLSLLLQLLQLQNLLLL